MKIARSLIYNQQLEVVAVQIDVDALALKQLPVDKQEIFSTFLQAAQKEVALSYRKSPHLICPLSAQPFCAQLPKALQEGIVFFDHLLQDNNNQIVKAWQVVDVLPTLQQLPTDSCFLFVPFSMAYQAVADIASLAEQAACTLIIQGVEDYQSLQCVKHLSTLCVQGTFIETPEQVCDQKNIPPNKLSVLNLISTLNKPNVTLEEASQVITADNVLSYKLLRIVNSPIFRGMTELNSIQEAVVRFGFGNLKKWVLMLSLCNVSDKPLALVKLALVRAILCASFVNKLPEAKITPEIAYTGGLLSTLNAFVDSSFEILFEETALTDEVKAAILTQQGELGQILATVIAFQRGSASQNYADILSESYVAAMEEASAIFSALGMS